MNVNVLFFILVGFLFGFFVFGVLFTLLSYVLRRSKIRERFQKIIKKAQKESDIFFEQAKESIERYKEELKVQSEREEESLKYRLIQFKSSIQEKEKDLYESSDQKKKHLISRQASLFQYRKQVSLLEKRFDELKGQRERLEKELILQLEQKMDFKKEDFLKEFREKRLQEGRSQAKQWSQAYLEEVQSDAERISRLLLEQVLHRFMNSSCHERGLRPVHLKNQRAREAVLGKNNDFLPIVEKLCGVDMVYNEKDRLISVLGFDPVRRELGRLVLERLMKARRVFSGKISFTQQVQSVFKKTKRDLLKKISRDGDWIAKRLKFSDLNENIKNMMGALRYRYSFTQNQYFHCAEVGFLCGLLSLELGLPCEKGRRAGLLHDIGKAMDHSIEGGHAVIGADFIKKNGEKADVVHAVRAHHYDEHPSTELAYLVIAADALSGARPGARHSTLEVYTQKVDQLQTIGNSFDGVLDTYVLSAGREVRVFVDSQKVTDHDAVQLSQDIAKEVELKCVYPGRIKVTVVRKTESVEVAN